MDLCKKYSILDDYSNRILEKNNTLHDNSLGMLTFQFLLAVVYTEMANTMDL